MAMGFVVELTELFVIGILRDPEMPPAISNLLIPTAAPVIKKVNWGVSTPGIEDRVASKEGEPTINGDLRSAEGVNEDAARSGDGDASVSAEVGDEDEAEDGDAEESSSAEEGNDDDLIPDDDDSSVSEVGENSNIEVGSYVLLVFSSKYMSTIRLLALFNEMHMQ